MSKNILVSTKFMCEVLMLTSYLHSEDDINLDEAKCLCLPLETYINDKCERMERRKIFTNYKTTPPSPERESFRKDYIKLAGIHRDWTSEQEVSYIPPDCYD